FGKSLLDGAALDAHYSWLPALFVIVSACTGGAVLRVTGHVFRGWGERPPPDEDQVGQAREEESEEAQAGQPVPALMVVVPALLLGAAVVIGLIPGAVPGIEVAAAHFRDHGSYIGWVLHGARPHFPAA